MTSSELSCAIASRDRAGRWRLARLIVLAAALALGAATLAPGARAAPRVRALVYRGAASPVLRELRAQLGRDLRLTPATPARLRQNRRYRLLILDGDALSPRALGRRRRAIDDYMNAGGWVLALDVRSGHFADALNHLTRFHVGGPGAKRASRAFLFRDASVHGNSVVVMLDAPRLVPIGAAQLRAPARGGATADQARRVAGLIRVRLLHPRTGLRGTGDPDPDIPPYLQHRQWTYSVPGAQSLPPAWWDETRRVGFDAAVHPPDQGHQTGSWVMNHTFDLYLEDATDGPAHQIVFYNLDGEFSPKRPDERFAYMYDPFLVDGIGAPSFYLERAWWTGWADVSVTPDAATDGKLTPQTTAPATPDETTSYSSGDDFSVGFSASPEEGPGFEASYRVGNVTTNHVPDWGVANQSAGNTAAWQFSARGNCDVRPATYSDDGCFNTGFGRDYSAKLPNDLSRSQLQLAASARWRTKALLTDPAAGKLTFRVATPVGLEDTYCHGFFFGACHALERNEVTTGPPPQTYTLDAADVAPVGIAPTNGLTLNPNPVDGTVNQKVTGTVTLAEPARIDTHVIIFSDDLHAAVGAPTHGSNVTRRVLDIPAGSTRATFTILTNDNRLPAGGAATAQITAWYGAATTAQLRVTAESGK